MMRPFRLALGLLTILPVRFPADATPEDFGSSVLYYPVIGLILGGILVGVEPGLIRLFPQNLSAALLLALWVWLTGGLHLDGLADCADAWAAHGDQEKTLAILKDPQSGPAAIVAMVLFLLLKWLALATVLGHQPWWHWIWVPVAGRGVMVALLLTTPYVNPNGMAAQAAAHLPRRTILEVLGGFGLLMGAVAGLAGLGLLMAASLVLLLGRRAMLHRLGGLTGDGLGALGELSELLFLLVLAGGSASP